MSIVAIMIGIFMIGYAIRSIKKGKVASGLRFPNKEIYTREEQPFIFALTVTVIIIFGLVILISGAMRLTKF